MNCELGLEAVFGFKMNIVHQHKATTVPVFQVSSYETAKNELPSKYVVNCTCCSRGVYDSLRTLIW